MNTLILINSQKDDIYIYTLVLGQKKETGLESN